MHRGILLGIGSLCLVACAGKPPANWVKGGAPIDVLPSRWVGSNSTVEVTPDGRVMLNTEHMMTVDRAGRVVDPDTKPLALLLPDGRVIGPDDAPLGFVGAWSASLPDQQMAWIAVMNTGEVVRFKDQGERQTLGVWVGGCNYSMRAHQMCTLVTHLLAMKYKDATPYPPTSWGRANYPPGMDPGWAYPGMYPGTVGPGSGFGF
jgi:hypothetical protein